MCMVDFSKHFPIVMQGLYLLLRLSYTIRYSARVSAVQIKDCPLSKTIALCLIIHC